MPIFFTIVVDNISGLWYIYTCQEGKHRKEVVKLEYLLTLLVTVLGNLITYFITRTIEERRARRKGTPKHMRQG